MSREKVTKRQKNIPRVVREKKKRLQESVPANKKKRGLEK